MSIPVVILVDRQGLVVSINARGENLEALIEATLAHGGSKAPDAVWAEEPGGVRVEDE